MAGIRIHTGMAFEQERALIDLLSNIMRRVKRQRSKAEELIKTSVELRSASLQLIRKAAAAVKETRDARESLKRAA